MRSQEIKDEGMDRHFLLNESFSSCVAKGKGHVLLKKKTRKVYKRICLLKLHKQAQRRGS